MHSNLMGISPTLPRVAEPVGNASVKPFNPTAASVDVLGLTLHNIEREALVAQVVAAARTQSKLLVVNANAQMMVLAQQLPWMRQLFQKSDIAFCDGAGVQLACKFLHGFALPRTTPPEWVGPVLQSLGADASIFWIGGTQEVVEIAAKRYEEQYGVRTAGIQHGFFDLQAGSADNAALVARINAARPTIILLNMGMPRQERWIHDHLDHIETGVIITAGALVDHAAGRVQRPPRWIADIGLEWAVRLLREPRRLWRRYLLGLPIFGFYVLRAGLESQLKPAALEPAINQQ